MSISCQKNFIATFLKTLHLKQPDQILRKQLHDLFCKMVEAENMEKYDECLRTT